jgi:hypothetical protein
MNIIWIVTYAIIACFAFGLFISDADEKTNDGFYELISFFAAALWPATMIIILGYWVGLGRGKK